ncbi:YHYH protein [Microbulbifer variabilis]|uniref:YHYH protein n=1 Tax=Microbulbifer variabilis TaxID=266805 RepID=A0ABY4VDW0_9GAMM|nr:YHYH protein [Microbulbifer variabilis]USD22175.1 YHYH protein [Microbulbifer variabilis]
MQEKESASLRWQLWRNTVLSALLSTLVSTSLMGCDQDDPDTPPKDDSGDNGGGNNGNHEPWILNTTGVRAPYIYESDSNEQVLVNIQSVESVMVDGKDYTLVTATGIPDYETEITDNLYGWLINRPKAATDFVSGSPIVQVGDVVSFGQDIGYRSNTQSCATSAGYGYWPPGPVCPENVSHQGYFPLAPEMSDENCESGLGAQGYWVNGTSIYQWSDGQVVDGTWHTLAPVAEKYDVDICGGHAARGDYHHHFYSRCLADLVGDSGGTHSPIYGFTADGYPIYGPWEADGELAISSWAIRNYDDPSAPSGCGIAGERSCLLIDEYDFTKGTEVLNNRGPSTSDIFTSLSGNTFITRSGFFYEDYYWDSVLTALGGAYLDQYNGHSDSERGYHYHLTVTQAEDGQLIPAFPYTFGPRFYGKLDSQTIVSVCSDEVGGGTPPGPPPR